MKIDYETGRTRIRPALFILRTGLSILVAAMVLSYPFPLKLKSVPGPPIKYTGVVVTSHVGQWVEGVRFVSGYKHSFREKDSALDYATKTQMHRYDLASSKTFRFLFWAIIAFWFILGPLVSTAERLWPDRPKMDDGIVVDSLTEFKRYMSSRREALLLRKGFLFSGHKSSGDQWYSRWYWDEMALLGVMILTISLGASLFLYTHPLNPKPVKANFQMLINRMNG